MSEDELRAKLDRLVDAVLYTTELYAEPIRYETGVKADGKAKRAKHLKPNLSIGFETRYQGMYDLALSYREGPASAERDGSER